MSEAKLSVGVEVDASSALGGFTDALLKELRPALDAARKEIDKTLGGGGGGKPGSKLGGDLSKSLAAELKNAGDAGAKALSKSLAAGLPAAEQRVQAAAKAYAAALTNTMAPGGKAAAEKWGQEFQSALRARDSLAPFAQSVGGSGGKFGGLGNLAAGSFIGSFASSLATKGIDALLSFARMGLDAVQGVLSSGWDRLVSIDTAKTKMAALKLTASEVEIVMSNALAAVKGTSFGLGDAATVAATALAAGVKPGQALTDYLKLTADTAAVARKAGADMGATFNEVGSILNKVTTQGYATNQELQMLSDKGLPIYQNLAKNLNLTTGEIIQMAEKSGVAASAVRTALQDTVGGAALKMGESFEGGMENARAAFARLGEAILKPIFVPAKDGLFTVTDAVDKLTAVVVSNGPEITRVFGAIAIAVVDMSEWVIQAVGSTIRYIGELIAPLGDMYGATLRIEEWKARLAGDTETADRLREQSEEAFSLGENWKEMGAKLEGVNTDPLKNKLRELTEEIANGQQANLEYAASQKQLAAAMQMGFGPLIYQGQLIEWNNKLRQAAATPGTPIPPMPMPPGTPQGGPIPGMPAPGGGSGMPEDVIKLGPGGGGGGDKEKAPLLFPAGTPIPSSIDLDLGPMPGGPGQPPMQVAVTNMPSTGLAPGALPGMPTGYFNPNNVSTSGLKPQSMAALSLIQSQFPDLKLISGFRASDPYEWHPGGRGLDISPSDPFSPAGKARGDQVNAWLQANKEMLGIANTLWQVADHFDHIHVSLKEGASPLMLGGALSGMPTAGLPGMPTAAMPAMPTMPGMGGWQAPDPTRVREQEQRIYDLKRDLAVTEQRLREMRADVAESQKMAALDEYDKKKRELKDAENDYVQMQQGTYSKGSGGGQFDFSQLPYGHPMRMAAGVLGGIGMSPQDIGAIIGGTAQPIGQAVGGAAGAIAGIPLPGPMGYPGVPTAPSTDLNVLAQQQNPMFWAQAAGINVPDFTRQGGDPSAQNITTSGGPPGDAMGRMYSDTAALIDRTFTSLDAADKARHDQVMSVLNDVRARLAKDYVEPVTTAAVTGGIDGLGSGTATAIGTAMGQAAAGPIASAVGSAGGGGGNGGIGAAAVNTSVQTVTNAVAGAQGFASGGAVVGPGTATSDSILARVSNGEWVLTGGQVMALGGFRGVQSLVNSLPRFATGGGVDVSATVGADLIGVGQVPIIAAVVNLLMAVLLKVIGVQIEARDTLNEIGADFREFRGDFAAFDAGGRMMNDTSGLLDRTGSSTEAAADERIRILKLVLEGLLKWIIEKIIVPISKAVANTAIQFGAQAVNGAITGGMGAAFPGGSVVGGMIGGMASSAISSAGQASVDIIAEVGTILAESLISVGLDALGSMVKSYAPGFTNNVIGGGLQASIVDPITSALNGAIGGATMLLGGLFGGLASLIPGLPFDDGGLAVGTGLMPKATIQPERVLSPQQTASFERLVDVLSTGRFGGGGTTIHAPFTVVGNERGARDARDRLLALMA